MERVSAQYRRVQRVAKCGAVPRHHPFKNKTKTQALFKRYRLESHAQEHSACLTSSPRVNLSDIYLHERRGREPLPRQKLLFARMFEHFLSLMYSSSSDRGNTHSITNK